MKTNLQDSVQNRHRPVVSGTRHMTVAGHHLAAQAGFTIMESGGNAIDAGIASIMTLAVVQPDVVNLAGVAPIIVYLAKTKEIVTISGLGVWPKLMTNDYFQSRYDGVIPTGIERSVVPAAPDAWITALSRYGTMTFKEVASAAVSAAEEGFPTHHFLSDRIKENQSLYASHVSNAEIYLPGGRPPEPGEMFYQKEAAACLKYMVDEEVNSGAPTREAGLMAARRAFYEGDIAKAIVDFHEKEGGFLRMSDFAEFNVAIEAPVSTTYRDCEVFSCGPWCQGPVFPMMLNLLEGYNVKKMRHNSASYVHTVAEAIKLVFSDREHYFGDPRFVDVPIDSLLSKEYAGVRRKLIDERRAWDKMPPPGDLSLGIAEAEQRGVILPDAAQGDRDGAGAGMDTSYACVVDSAGNVFSGTPSDPSYDGVVVPGTGLCPSTRGSQSRGDPNHPSSVVPGKRPRLTPNPAIVMKGNRPLLPIGTPGGDAQAQSMLQVFLNIVEFGMDPQSAVEAPRFMSQSFPNSFAPNDYFPGRLNLEPRVGKAIGSDLSDRGHDVNWWADWFWRLGAVCTIKIDSDQGTLQAGADPRNESYAVGR